MCMKNLLLIDQSVDEQRAIKHLLDLLTIEGLSGREGKVAETVTEKLINCGCNPNDIFYDDTAKKAPQGLSVGNLILKLPGTINSERRLFISHLDTVPLCRGAIPIRRGNRIIARGKTGLGADNRTAVACLVLMIETILEKKLPHPPLTILFTVGEEVGLVGSRTVTLRTLGNPKMGFNVDSGKPEEFIIGAVGADRWEVHIYGESSHAGVHPEDGISAMLIASLAIADTARKGYFGKIELNGKKGTANVGIINGGEATNQITDYVYVRGESRAFDVNFIDEINEAYRQAFQESTDRVKNRKGQSGTFTFSLRRDYLPFLLNQESKIVAHSKSTASLLGFNPKLITVSGGLDANALNAKGIPTITFGAGQHNAHTVDEYVDIFEFLNGCRLAIALAINTTKTAPG